MKTIACTLRPALSLAALAALATLATLAGCASARPSAAGAVTEEGLAVEVENEVIPSTPLTIWLVAQTGTRDMLGTVAASRTEVLVARGSIFDGSYRLMAETTAGEELWSHPFFLERDTRAVSWDLRSNIVTFPDS